MKTGEMYAYALSNRDAKFKRPKMNEETYKFNEKGILMVTLHGEYQKSAVVPELDEDWELVREPVDFMTAVNSGKNIASEFWKAGDNLKTDISRDEWLRISIHEINGKWYIE